MRPGAAREVGLSAEDLAVVNPNLIYASFSAFGPTGPDAHRRGVDGVAQAESGLASLQNGVLGGTSFVDTTAGLALSQAILIALMKRDRFGVVEPVDVCLLDTAVYMQAAPIAEFSVEGVLRRPEGLPVAVRPGRVYEAADGPFFMAPYWERTGRPSARSSAGQICAPTPASPTEPLAGSTWSSCASCSERSSPAGRGWNGWRNSNTTASSPALCGATTDVLDDPQLRANQALEQHVLTDGRTAVFPRAPFRFAGQPLEGTRSAPELGADTAGLLAEIGVDTAALDHLYEAGVITCERAEVGDRMGLEFWRVGQTSPLTIATDAPVLESQAGTA